MQRSEMLTGEVWNRLSREDKRNLELYFKFLGLHFYTSLDDVFIPSDYCIFINDDGRLEIDELMNKEYISYTNVIKMVTIGASMNETE